VEDSFSATFLHQVTHYLLMERTFCEISQEKDLRPHCQPWEGKGLYKVSGTGYVVN